MNVNIQNIDIIRMKRCKSLYWMIIVLQEFMNVKKISKYKIYYHKLDFNFVSLYMNEGNMNPTFLQNFEKDKQLLPWTLAPSSLVGHVHDCNARPATVESHFFQKKTRARKARGFFSLKKMPHSKRTS